MPANTKPIFTLTPDIQWIGTVAAPVLTANTSKDGSSGTIYTAFTADATNGGFIKAIRFRALGTNIATLIRVFVNNGSVNTTALNNCQFDEIALPASTLSETVAIPTLEYPLNFALPAGYKIFVTVATGVAAGYTVSVVGGKY